MDDLTNRRTPQHVIEALDASVRDIAEGNLHDAEFVQAEARRILPTVGGLRLPRRDRPVASRRGASGRPDTACTDESRRPPGPSFSGRSTAIFEARLGVLRARQPRGG